MIQPDWLVRQAAVRPRHEAIIAREGAVDFQTLEARVGRRAARLADCRRGARVGVVLDAGVPLVETLLACLRMGRSAVLIDPRLGQAEARPLVEAATPVVVVGGGETSDLARDLADHVDAELQLLDEDGGRTGRPAPAQGVDLDAEAVVVFSSGTSGRPKPVALTAGNLLWSALASAARLGSHPADRWLACLPLSHVGGLSVVFRSVLFGTTLVLQRGFDEGAVRSSLAADAISLISLVPTTLGRLLDGAGLSAPALRCALIGGASAPIDLLERARAAGVPAAPTYGMTETASQVATLPPGEEPGETGRVGCPLLPTEVQIRGDDHACLPVGEIGHIMVRGPTVAPGASGPDGWLRSDDLGRLDARGALTVLGRRDDVIVTGGENVSPAEVEAVLGGCVAVAEVGVAAVPDARWGQVVGAWVVPCPGERPTLEQLRAACDGRLAPHKRPRRLFLTESLPRTALGKLRRAELAALARRGGEVGSGDGDVSP